MVSKYVKKPVTIEAIQFIGKNFNECKAFCPNLMIMDHTGEVFVPTLKGNMKVSITDWIIKGVKGEFYPCKHDIFAQTYDPQPIMV